VIQLEITFIGCGDAFSKILGHNSALLTFHETNLLIDIPDSNYIRIEEMGLIYSDIDNLFITHLHADHINGLEKLAYFRKFISPLENKEKPVQKVNLYIHETLKDSLWESAKNGLKYTNDGEKTLEDYFNVITVRDSFEINGLTFYLIQSKHVPNMPVYGLFVENEFYYSADSIYDSSLLQDILPKVKKVFYDIHFYPYDIPAHASVRDFSKLAFDEKEKVYAMHYDDSKVKMICIEGIKLVQPFQKIKI
jgi:phosphoribosyl 1,2-cyclic phosphodiesterase